MPRTQTYDLHEEADRLQAERRQVAESAVELEDEMLAYDDVPDSLRSDYQDTLADGHQLDRHLTGLEWATDPPEGDAIGQLTLSALTAGDEQWVTGRTSALADQLADKWGTDADDVDGGRVLHVAAVGIEDCPRWDGPLDPETRVDRLRTWHASFVRWVASRVDDLSTPEVDGKNFAALLREHRPDDQPDSSGADSS